MYAWHNIYQSIVNGVMHYLLYYFVVYLSVVVLQCTTCVSPRIILLKVLSQRNYYIITFVLYMAIFIFGKTNVTS